MFGSELSVGNIKHSKSVLDVPLPSFQDSYPPTKKEVDRWFNPRKISKISGFIWKRTWALFIYLCDHEQPVGKLMHIKLRISVCFYITGKFKLTWKQRAWFKSIGKGACLVLHICVLIFGFMFIVFYFYINCHGIIFQLVRYNSMANLIYINVSENFYSFKWTIN